MLTLYLLEVIRSYWKPKLTKTRIKTLVLIFFKQESVPKTFYKINFRRTITHPIGTHFIDFYVFRVQTFSCSNHRFYSAQIWKMSMFNTPYFDLNLYEFKNCTIFYHRFRCTNSYIEKKWYCTVLIFYVMKYNFLFMSNLYQTLWK